MKIKKKLTTGTLLLSNALIAGEPLLIASADKLDDSISNAKNKGYDVEVTASKKVVRSKDELAKSEATELANRAQEADKLNQYVARIEKEKSDADQTLSKYEAEVNRLTAEYEKKFNNYKAELDRVTKERERLIREHTKKVRDDQANINNRKNDTSGKNDNNYDKYLKDLSDYTLKLKLYEDEVARIESDYRKALAEYNNALTSYNITQDGDKRRYENLKRDIEERNKKAQALYEQTKREVEERNRVAYENYEKNKANIIANNKKAQEDYEKQKADTIKQNEDAVKKYEADKDHVKKENERLKAEYLKRVADIREQNRQNQETYKKRLAEWENNKRIAETTVKTKELTDDSIKNRVTEIKGKGIDVSLGNEEVVEVDGTTGSISEADAKKRLDTLVTDRLAKLKTIEANGTKAGAQNKEYQDYVNKIKGELGKLSNVKINYTNGDPVTNVSAAKSELDKKLAQAKQKEKLAAKIKELNAKIDQYESTIVNKLKQGGLSDSDAQSAFSKKKSLSDFKNEVNVLVNKADVTDQDIAKLSSDVEAKLREAESSIQKVINKANSPSTGTELDDAEYDRKLSEYKDKIRAFNANRNKKYNAYDGIVNDMSDILSFDRDGAKNKTNMVIRQKSGDVTFYQGKNYSVGDNVTSDWMDTVYTSNLPQSDGQTISSTGKVEYSPVKLGRNASVTIDYTMKDGSTLLDPNDTNHRMVLYKVVGGKRVPATAKTMRWTVTNHGTARADGSSFLFVTNDIASPLNFVFSSRNGEYTEDLSDKFNEGQLNYSYDFEFLDETGARLSVGNKVYDEVDSDSYDGAKVAYHIESAPEKYPTTYRQYTWELANGGAGLHDDNHNLRYGWRHKNISETMPSDWSNIKFSKDYNAYKDTNNDDSGFVWHNDEIKIGTRESYLATAGRGTGATVEGASYEPGSKYYMRVTQAGWTGSGRENDGFVPLEPFRYTRKNATVSTVGKLSGTVTIDVPIGATKPYNPGADGNIRPVKVVYKYKETFTQDPPGKPTDTDIPNEADVHYLKDPNPPVAKPLPTPPTPKSVPNEPAKIPQPTPPIPEKVPEYVGDGKKPPVKPVKPALPTKPVEPTKPPKDGNDGDRPNRELDLPDLPTPPEKPILPDKPVVNKPEGQKFRVHKTEYEFVPTTYFEDESGNKIIPNEDGDKPKRDIPGYDYIRTITDKDGNKHHIYKKVQILTHWIDKEGNKLQNDKPGKYPDNDGVSDIPGYRLIEVRNEPNGDVTNIYTKVRTYFKDPEGHDIIPPEDGDKPKRDIPGYEYVGPKKDKDGNTIHVYRKITQTTHWIDKEGNKLQNDKSGKHPDNDGVSDIPGYRLIEVRNEPNGDVTNIYTKVRTYFKDPEGRDIIPPEDGDKPKRDIPGYEYVGPKKDKDGNTIHVYRKITQITHWIDKDGNKLQNDKPGKHPDNDGVSDIPGYRLINVRNEPNGDVTNIYTKVRTYFKDPEGHDIIPPEDGDKPKRDIPGYAYVGPKKDKDGNTIHVYRKITEVTHWVDKDGNKLQNDKPGKHPDNDGVSDIPGYRLIEVRNEPNGDVTNIYTKVRTYFKDSDGHDIIPPEDGENPKKDIPGYEYVGTKKDKDGNTAHVYRKITEVTHWIDKEGNKLQNDKPGKHPDNDGVSDILGYRLVNVRNEQNGDVSNIYTKVRTYFKDPEGRDIIPPEDGENPKKDIPGYRYVESKKDKDGNTVHVYEKVKTYFRDTDGKEILPAEDGEIAKKDIPGYRYLRTEKDKDGNVIHVYQKVKTHFKDTYGKEIIPAEDGEIAKKDIPGYTYLRTEKDKDGNIVHVYKKTPSGKKLPETGDPASLLGIGLGSLIAGRRLRRKNK